MQNSDVRLHLLNSEFCILISDIFAVCYALGLGNGYCASYTLADHGQNERTVSTQ